MRCMCRVHIYCANGGLLRLHRRLAGRPGAPNFQPAASIRPGCSREGWQGFSGQNSFLEFGKSPFAPGRTAESMGGGLCLNASVRRSAAASATSWTPVVPHVTINLYKEGTAPDGTTSLTLVDTTKTSSFDDWAQGFRSDGMSQHELPWSGHRHGHERGPVLLLAVQPAECTSTSTTHGGTAAHTHPQQLPVQVL